MLSLIAKHRLEIGKSSIYYIVKEIFKYKIEFSFQLDSDKHVSPNNPWLRFLLHVILT